jgi:hypothetical protein
MRLLWTIPARRPRTRDARRGLLALACCVSCLLLPACSRYDQDTPESVLVSARQMVQDGHAERLTDLIYADSPQMRALLDQIGGLMGTLQDLALTVQKAYPKEIDKLRADAEEAARSGNATSFLQQMVGQASQGRRRRGDPPPDPDSMRSTFDNAVKEIFADPYAWLQKSEGRLTVKTVTDDTAALLWDGKPVFGVGLMLKEEKGRWYLMLPTVGPAASILPKTEEGWEILGSLVDVFDNTLLDLSNDVKAGKCKRLDDLAAAAGEKAFLPAMLAFLAYGKYMEAERPDEQQNQPRRRGRANPPAAPASTGAPPPSGAPAPTGG